MTQVHLASGMLKIVTAFFFLSACLFGQTASNTKKKKWPTSYSGKMLHNIKNSKQGDNYVYESQHFIFISEMNIAKKDILQLASNADSVPGVLSKIPLNLYSPPKYKDGEKPIIYVFTNENAKFKKAGGSKEAAGLYSGVDQAVFIRHASFIKNKRPNYTLLTHELTHLCMHGVLQNTNPWFNEGNAEYLSIALKSTRRYKFNDLTEQIPKDTKRYLSPDQEVYKLPDLKTLISRSNKEWREVNEDLPITERYLPYQASVLLIHYFYHLDQKGRDKVAEYLEKSGPRGKP